MFERLKKLWKPCRLKKRWIRPKVPEFISSVNELVADQTEVEEEKKCCTKKEKNFTREPRVKRCDGNDSENEAEQSTFVFCNEVELYENKKVNKLQQELQLYHREHCSALNEVDRLPNLKRERVIGILNSHYPPIEFFDFCVIASDNDFDLAQRLVQVLRDQGLCGRVAGSDLGGDIFQEYDVLISSSTKIMFLITEDFTADRFCRRLQSAAVFQSLLTRISQERDRCVPVFVEASGRLPPRIPLPLIGVAGLNLSEPRAVVRRIRNTYTAEVKGTKILRALNYLEERENFSKRLLSDESFDLLFENDRLTSLNFNDSVASMISGRGSGDKDELFIGGATARGVLPNCSEPVTPVKGIVSGVESLISGLGISADEDSRREWTLSEEQTQQYVNVEGSSDVHVGPQINLIVNVHNGPVTNVVTDSE
ncbi:uncharacterized protein LOC112494036 [Cephus cinctus]|uniref:Uncharacterized protein LOC112494036 n=1 Tax=Cephus cinctus TaxID=211228 RepID=A0AAJ7RCT1_CEPCN|nr:uncharacterized protein LOC112494036 [Cephus cinctus]